MLARVTPFFAAHSTRFTAALTSDRTPESPIAGDPLADINLISRVGGVMQGGRVYTP